MAVLFVLPVILLAVLGIIFRMAFYSPVPGQDDIYDIPVNPQYMPYRQTMTDLIDDLKRRPYEEVWITSRDGLQLFGRYYHYHDGAPLDIAFHGYRGTAFRDMCGGIQLSYKAGHNVLLVDQRAHGRSGGHTIAFGVTERWDCLSWVEYAKNRFGSDVRILLYGVSMGAATVLMAAGLDDINSGGNVVGVIADCPYSSPKDIIKKVCADRKYPPVLTWPLVALSARLLGRFNPSAVTAADAVRQSSLPVLILHGEDDRYVPEEMSREIACARSGIERHSFPGAGHGISGIVHMEEYNRIVLDFIKRCCPEEK